MTEHGIHTCASSFWIHFHPLDLTMFDIGAASPCVYWYAVEHCRDFIARHKLPIQLGRSKDAEHTVTNEGYHGPEKKNFHHASRCRFATRPISNGPS